MIVICDIRSTYPEAHTGTFFLEGTVGLIKIVNLDILYSIVESYCCSRGYPRAFKRIVVGAFLN